VCARATRFLHRVEDYVDAMRAAGFAGVAWREWRGDEALAAAIPAAARYLGFPILLLLQGTK
jgi:hypothetical protein